MRTATASYGLPARKMLRTIAAHRQILASITTLELQKRYAGSMLGRAWLVLQPALLLSIYLFVYMVVFRVRFPGYSSFDYVLYVFCGLIPYLGFSEALSTGCVCLKQNLHLVKNVILPIELIPVRTVLVSAAGQLISLAILLVLAAGSGMISPNVVALPLVLLLQLLFTVGLVFMLSAAALAIPDVGYFVNLTVLLLMFISPIGFKVEMVPAAWRFVVFLNPIYYLTEAYRSVLLQGAPVHASTWAVFIAMSIVVFVSGAAFFARFKDFLVDFE